ncbi:alpha/beta hydrolase family protein [Paraglaciecola marina]|uniref:alpha/beta hydrolase family protein n=1 Tax=Paraglaciecola marina TaxID=2500157 RepID=UPI00105B7EEE|nr:alpha/beta hydrolase [Paraglaciecola marina]
MTTLFLNTLAGLSLTLVSFLTIASKPLITFPTGENNLAYSKVAELPFSTADVKISYGPNPLQYALYWEARVAGQVDKRPLVVLIHGGCWLSAYDIQHTYALSTGLAQAGFNVWSLEYRRTGDLGGGWPSTYDDIKAGILASAQYKNGEFELANSVLVGHSAGGHLALLAGGAMSELKGVIGLAAINDIEEYARGSNSCQTVTKDFMGGMPKDKPQQYKLANPSKQPLHLNSFLLQGTQDNIVPAFNLEKLNRKVVMLDGVGHFDWIHPGSEAFKTLTFYLNELSK